MYSQNNEEQIITGWFDKNPPIGAGKFFDIGAYHPTKFSNTRKLFEMGWCGVFVEPDPVCMANLRKEYGDKGYVAQLVEKAVITELERSKGSKTIKLYHSKGDAVSTTEIAHKEKWENTVKYDAEAIDVQTITIKELKKEWGVPDFINLDVEGLNLDIFKELVTTMFEYKRLRMVCVEHDGHWKEMVKLAHPHGFTILDINPENLIIIREF